MLSNKIHLLKKIKNNANNIVLFIKEISELRNEFSLLKQEIEKINKENEEIKNHINSVTYAVNVLNLVVENIVYDKDDYIDLKKKINYH